MARKGGQNKSGPNLSSPNQQYIDSRSLSGDKLNTPEIDVAAGGNPSSHVKCRSKHSGENNSQKMRSNKKGKHRNTATSSLGKSDDKALYNQQSVDMRCNTSNPEEKDLLSSATEIRRESEKSSQHGCGKDLSLEKKSVRMFAENVLEKARCIACMAASILRTSIMYVMEESKGFIERKKPAITSFMTAVSKGHTYVRCKIQYAYPIVWAWMFNAGKLLLLLLMVWLDCNMRGFDSLLRLGTTSFLAILWCSMLSIFAMIGMKKMLIFMVTAVSVAAFVGLGFAVLITSVFALIILWLYGSFWMTIIVIILGGASFFLNHERFAILVTSLYSMYCAKSYVGWLGLLLSLNLSFISSDVLVQFLRSNVDDNKFNGSSKNSEQSQGRSGNSGEFHSSSTDGASPSGYGRPTDRSPDDPSTSGAEKELTAEDEVIRLLNCTDHYSALGFRRYENIDVSLLKREYKKKAMLVHPDKNMGNEKSADAFKKLQNAYEVLLDSFKQKTYDDELRREELLNYFRRFQGASQKKGTNGTFRPGFSPSEGVDEGPYGLSRRIACKKCGDFHTWIYTGRAKSQARWCQECKEFHQAKDGDGWVEQSFQPLLFGMLQKRDFPRAYVCAESRIFDVTEWFSCQGMRCPANTHRPSFQVNTSLAKQGSAKGSTSTHRGGGVPNGTNMDEGINEEEFFEWLQNAVQSGVFETFGAQSDHPSAGGGSNAKSSSGKKKRKGKKQW